MPAPAKVSIEQIVAVGRSLLEESGEEGLTMQAIAERVGVRAPSLYKHVRDRDDLIDRVRMASLDELRATLSAVRGDDPRDRLLRTALATREFATRWPHGKALIFDGRAPVEILAIAVEPILDACTALVGDADALNAARTLTAWMHGFSEMEHAGAFRLGGDVDDAYRAGIDTIIAGIVREPAGDAAPAGPQGQ